VILVGDCVEADGPRNNGYVRISVRGRQVYAHRLAYEEHVGPIPFGYDVCHHCDNRACVWPSHLFVGTRKDNMADCVAKGRQAQGERSGPSKLTTSQVLAIRRLAAAGASQRELARRFDVSQGTIWPILSRRTWRHV